MTLLGWRARPIAAKIELRASWRARVASWLTLAVVIPLAIITLATTAFAQTDPDIKAGDSAASSGKWEEAYAAYDKAHKANPTAESGRKRANALYKLDRTVEAYEAYEELLRDHGPKLARPDKDTALERRDKLRDKTGTIKINVSETGAQVTLDDRVIGASPLNAPIRTTVGKHTVKVEKPGFRPFTTEIDLGPKAALSVDARLEQVADAGTVEVTVKGGEPLSVFIDGKEVGTTPFTGKLGPGPHIAT